MHGEVAPYINVQYFSYRVQLIGKGKAEESGLKYLDMMTGSSGL